MIKHLYIVFLLFLSLLSNAQDIKVVSFTPDMTDMTANLEGTIVYDQNGDKCALIKIETTEKGFTFDVGMLGIVKTEYHPGEIWLYVPYGVKSITISHPIFGVLRDYDMGMSVKQARTYILKLAVTKNTQTNSALMQQFVLFNVTPINSFVELDGEPLIVQSGKAHKLKPFGTYKYSVSANNYHTQTGEVTISDIATRKEVNVNLLPAFGEINITAESLRDAYIYIDNEMIGKAPISKRILSSGTHKIVVVKPLYKSYEATITITDGEQKQFTPQLQPNYADVTLTTDSQSEIWLNGEKKSVGSWSGKLEIGSYIVECKRPSHTTTKEIVEITTAGIKNIKLKTPQPIYGMLTISADQPDATIYFDGKNIGVTPQYLPQTLIGVHNIKITKYGCADWVGEVTVSEGKMSEVNAALQTGKSVQFISTKNNTQLYVDGEYKGPANATYILSYGTHNVLCKAPGEKDYVATITVTKAKDIQRVECSFFNPVEMEMIAELSKDEMVYVEGGTFTMGATSEQGSDYYSNERPTHQVTLSSYYIGKYEVTQQLWEYVMSYSGKAADGTTMTAYSSDVWLGTNPSSSNGKGDYYPAYYVSWNDIVNIFLPRLNKITGGNYRLPTETEWEYAARGGKNSQGYKYSGSNTIGDVAWYYDNSGSKTHTVGTKQPNELGIYDMSGNVYEWCSDCYGRYSSSAQTNPTDPTSGSYRVVRGGCWSGNAKGCRVSNRDDSYPGDRDYNLGFRLASSLKP